MHRHVRAPCLQSTVCVGIDTEWRDPRPHCAIIQLALPHVVYLVDTYLPLSVDGNGTVRFVV